MLAPGAHALQRTPQGHLGRRAGPIEQGPGQQPANPLIDPQHQRERAQPPARRGLGQQPVLPLPPVGQQSGLHLAGDLLGQHGALLVDGGLHFPHVRQRFVDPRTAGVERIGRQVEEVGPADAVAGRAGHLPGEQIEQIGKLAPRLQAVLRVGQCMERIDAEDVESSGPLSLWERVRVRASGGKLTFSACPASPPPSPPAPLPKGEGRRFVPPTFAANRRGCRRPGRHGSATKTKCAPAPRRPTRRPPGRCDTSVAWR